MIDTIPSDVRTRIDRHLDAVETQLNAASIPRRQRRAITDDLETQILDMLAAVPKHPPTVADVESVLAQLDPPEAYKEETERPVLQPALATSHAVTGARLNQHAKWGAVCLGFGVVGQLLLFEGAIATDAILSGRFRSPLPLGHALESQWVLILFALPAAITTAVAAIVCPLVATWWGWVATSRIRRSAGSEYGLGLAVLEAVFYPLLVIWGGTLVARHWVVAAIWTGSALTTQQWLQMAYGTLSFVAGAAVMSAAYLWLLWRVTVQPRAMRAPNGWWWYRTPTLARFLTNQR
jgi:hypothetical protein